MKITTQIIKDLEPCKDRLDNFIEHYANFEGDHEEFLSLENITHNDKLWVTLRLMDRIDVEVFAIDCAVSAASPYAAAYAAAAYAASVAAAYYASNTEQERQLDAICYLIDKSELNEN